MAFTSVQDARFADEEQASPRASTVRAEERTPQEILRGMSRTQLGLIGSAYCGSSVVVGALGFLGAYLVAAESTAAALGVSFGVLLPICTAASCIGGYRHKALGCGFVVAGCAIAVITVGTGE